MESQTGGEPPLSTAATAGEPEPVTAAMFAIGDRGNASMQEIEKSAPAPGLHVAGEAAQPQHMQVASKEPGFVMPEADLAKAEEGGGPERDEVAPVEA